MVVSEWPLWATCALGWTLLALAVIDQRHLVLPDELTLPLLVAGLIVVLAQTVFGRRVATDERIPFGPYLCLATWLVWLYGPLVL